MGFVDLHHSRQLMREINILKYAESRFRNLHRLVNELKYILKYTAVLEHVADNINEQSDLEMCPF